MSEPQSDNPFHLPSPSAQPLIVSLGAALMLVGLVPDSRLWRMAIISIGGTAAAIGICCGCRTRLDEYRNLPDD